MVIEVVWRAATTTGFREYWAFHWVHFPIPFAPKLHRNMSIFPTDFEESTL